MNVILESLLEEGGVDDDGAKGFRVSRQLQKLALAIATSRMTSSCCSANTHIKANGFMLGEGVHPSTIIPSPITTPWVHPQLNTCSPMLLKSSEKRKKGKKDSAESWYRERWFSIAMVLKKAMGKASEQSTAIT
jgi:hypothetical protein